MLPNLADSVREMLLRLEEKVKGSQVVPVKYIVFELEKDPFCKLVISWISKEKLETKSVNINTLLSGSYSEAYKEQSSLISYKEVLFSLLKILKLKAEYKKSKAWKAISKAQESLEKVSYKTKPYLSITDMAVLGKLPKIVGREKEVNAILANFLQPNRKPLLLSGATGIGKTSIVYKLAQNIVNWKVPRSFLGARVVALDFLDLGSQQDFYDVINNSLKGGAKTIIFFDDIHISPSGNLFGLTPIPVKKSFGITDFDSPINFIGATSKVSKSDKLWSQDAFEAWGEYPVLEMSKSSIIKIVQNKVKAEGIYKNVDILSKDWDFLYDISLKDEDVSLANPGKILGLLDLIIAKKRIKVEVLQKKDLALKNDLDKLFQKMASSIENSSSSLAIKYSEMLSKKEKQMEEFLNGKVTRIVISKKDILSIKKDELEKPKTNAGKLQANIKGIVNIEKELKKYIVGQDIACDAIGRSVRKAESAIVKRGNRPQGAFLFLGPTGVGKTETAKVLARVLKGIYSLTTPNFLRLDMADFMEKHTASRLVGAPPGYVGYDEGGQLTEFVLQNPKSIILFDEIEKAHGDVLNMLLSIMEEGELTDGTGETVSFKDCILILTSNIGSDLLGKKEIGYVHEIEENLDVRNKKLDKEIGSLGLDKNNPTSNIQPQNLPSNIQHPTSSYELLFLSSAKKTLKPEFINRLDEIVVFKQLNKDDLLKIIALHLDPIIKNLASRKIKLMVNLEAKEEILKRGNFTEYGAREIRRIIEKDIIDPINLGIFQGKIKSGGVVEFSKELKNSY